MTSSGVGSGLTGLSGLWSKLGDQFVRLGAWFPLAVALVSALVLLIALASEYAGHQKPCVLCISQRYPYVIALILGLIGNVFYGNIMVRVMMLAVVAIGFIYGLSVGVYQVGAEWSLWADGAACGGTVIAREGVTALTPTIVRCDESAWTLFGVSMAGYNVLLSAALAVATAVATWFSFAREA